MPTNSPKNMAVFETIRIHRGIPLFLKEHYHRFKEGYLLLKSDGLLIYKNWGQTIYQAVKRSGVKEGILRLYSDQPMQITDFPFKTSDSYSLYIHPKIKPNPYPLSQYKTSQYAHYLHARSDAQAKGAIDAILLNEEGRIADGATSSLFLIKRGKLFTPALNEGALKGTRRSIILKLAKKLGIKTYESKITRSDLKSADEVFITSALKDIVPIHEIGPITFRLMSAYQLEVLREVSESKISSNF